MNVVVTGAGKGIGRAVAERLAARGDGLVLVDIDEAALNAVAELTSAAGSQVRAVVGSVAEAATAEPGTRLPGTSRLARRDKARSQGLTVPTAQLDRIRAL